jgi:hypothetical protein
LGVGKLKAHDEAGDSVEAAAEELAVERLAMGLAAFLKPSGADGDVRSGCDGGKQALGLFDGRRQVGVGKHDHVALGLKKAGADAVALAAIAGIFKQADFGRRAGELAHQVGRGVG